MSTAPKTPPRVFISYSWTSDDHCDWVADLGARLMANGVDVVLDQWSLKEGQDLNSFMEQMVTDSTIHRVIIVSDSEYARKADARKGGVGAESQIISQEVYNRVDQEKFIPVAREKDEEGQAYMPVFLKSRKYIDFSNPDSEMEAQEQLLRNIFDRPIRRKPTLGAPPPELFDDSATPLPAAQKSRRFLDIVRSGKGNASSAFISFAEEFVTNLEVLRIEFSEGSESTWCQTMFDSIQRSYAFREIFVDVLVCGARNVHDDWFCSSVHELLEQMLPFGQRPKKMVSSYECSEDNYKFILSELFLYTFAAFVKARRFSDARELLERRYVVREYLDSDRLVTRGFDDFYAHPDTLERLCAVKGNTRRISVVADLLHERAKRKDIRFSDIAQADVICCLFACRSGPYCTWWPKSLVYSNGLGKLELFARAINEKGFQPFRELGLYDTPQDMIQYICSEQMNKIWTSEIAFRSADVDELLNLSDVKKLAKGAK